MTAPDHRLRRQRALASTGASTHDHTGSGVPMRSIALRSGRQVDPNGASVEEFIDAGICFAGTPDMVVEQFKAFHSHVGGFGHPLIMGQGGHITHDDTVNNLTLFSKEVLPRLAELG